MQKAVQYTNTQTNYQAPTSSFVGTWQQSNEAMIPRWKGIGTIDYLWNNWLFHWDTRYIEGTVSFDGTDETTPTMYYHDFSVAYTMKNMGPISNTRFVLGVNNLFDKNPPFLAGDSIYKCNTLAGPYDVIGRFVYARADMHF